ncbi:TlpA family protein disulfide reductase [Symbioplanes lichenis]|uniref:TlpA family protein disulfide reductase n=1 Tax=Symbioplanes lichenis TaxID=1629072 RepID=UPI00273A3B4E|nr:TlpA disulfide reductase family protein [Actinoplanes lichenis]
MRPLRPAAASVSLRAATWVAAPMVLVLGGCTAGRVAPEEKSEKTVAPFAACAGLTDPLPSQAASPAPSSISADSSAVTDSDDSRLPDVSLPCFTGGEQIRVADLPGPAVINLWGSWCGPCREELPLMQELSDVTAGRLRVLGVDTRDQKDAGASFAAEHMVSMPTLYDRETKLLTALGRSTLPVTVFVDPAGETFVYTGQALDKPTLGRLVREHTGVTVA